MLYIIDNSLSFPFFLLPDSFIIENWLFLKKGLGSEFSVTGWQKVYYCGMEWIDEKVQWCVD
jgi:hypothetical protein